MERVHQYLHITNGGAGSGKTTQLKQDVVDLATRHKAKLVNNAQSILVISYTNVAVDEIRARIAQDYGEEDWFACVEFCTIHSLARSLLAHFKAEVAALYVQAKNPDRKKLKLEEFSFGDVEFGHEDAYASYSRKTIAHLQAEQLAQAPTLGQASGAKAAKQSSGAQGATKSRTNKNSSKQKQLPAKIKLDHDQVISAFTYLLARDPRVGYALTRRYPLLLIDEAQDCDLRLGLELIALYKRELARLEQVTENPLCQVRLYGDPNQQIYDYHESKADLKPTGDFLVNYVHARLRAAKSRTEHRATALENCKAQANFASQQDASTVVTEHLYSNLLQHLLSTKTFTYKLCALEQNRRSSRALQNFFANFFGTLLPNYTHRPDDNERDEGKVNVIKLASDFQCQCCLEQQWEQLKPHLEEFGCVDWVVLYPHRHDVVASRVAECLKTCAASEPTPEDTALATTRAQVVNLFKSFLTKCADSRERKSYLRALAMYFEQVVFPLVSAEPKDFDQVLLALMSKQPTPQRLLVEKVHPALSLFNFEYCHDDLWGKLKSLAKYFADANLQVEQDANTDLTSVTALLAEAKAVGFAYSSANKNLKSRLRATKANFLLAAYWLYLLNGLIPLPLSNKLRSEAEKQPDGSKSGLLKLISKLARINPQVLKLLLNQYLPAHYFNALSNAGNPQVKVTNIHKVKGQEFDNVMVVVQRHSLKFSGKSSFSFFNSLCKHGVNQAEASQAEGITGQADYLSAYKRDLHLLYVACTRARKNLLLVLVEPTGEQAQASAPSLFTALLQASQPSGDSSQESLNQDE